MLQETEEDFSLQVGNWNGCVFLAESKNFLAVAQNHQHHQKRRVLVGMHQNLHLQSQRMPKSPAFSTGLNLSQRQLRTRVVHRQQIIILKVNVNVQLVAIVWIIKVDMHV